MRIIKIEVTLRVPDNYKVDEKKLEQVQVYDLLDALEDRYSNVTCIDGKIIGCILHKEV